MAPAMGLANKAPNSKPYTGNLALHCMRGIANMVKKRTRRLAMVRVAMIAGIAQAQPANKGTKLRPFKPILLSGRSIRTALLAKHRGLHAPYPKK